MSYVVSENGYVSFPGQLIDDVVNASYKWFTLSNNVLDGTYHPLSSDGSCQVGWIGATASDANGVFTAIPSVEITFSARSIHGLKFAGDNLLNNYPVDFNYYIYDGANNILASDTVRNNAQVLYTTSFPNVIDGVVKIRLEIIKISKPNDIFHILEANEDGNVQRSESLAIQATDTVAMLGSRIDVNENLNPKILDNVNITASMESSDAYKPSTSESSSIRNIHTVMNESSRQVFGKVEILYTDPLLDGPIDITSDGDNRISNDRQLLDGGSNVPYKWFSLFDNKLDGSYHLPDADAPVGWWGNEIAQADGTFIHPQIVALTFTPRPINKICVVGDSMDNNFPVDFDVNLYHGDTLALTHTVRNNTLVAYDQPITAIGSITKMELCVYKLNKQSVCKILEFFTIIMDTYQMDDLASIHLLEELAYEGGDLPLGTISSNEIDISLVNKDRVFDISNTESYLYTMLRKNRKITAWLGAKVTDEIEWHKLGVFWSTEWKAPFSDVNAAVTARDKLELLRNDQFLTSQLYTNYSLYQLYEVIFTSYGLSSSDYQIDTTLQSIVIPYVWFDRMSYRDALAELAKCAFVQVYCNHDGIIIVKVSATSNDGVTTFSDDNNITDFNLPMSGIGITNSVEVKVNTLSPDSASDIYSSTDSITIPANTTEDITCIYSSMPNINVQNPALTMDSGLVVAKTASYVWGVILTVNNPTAQPLNITGINITGTPLKVNGTSTVTVEDSVSILTEGRNSSTVDHMFIQTRDYANILATKLLSVYANQRANINLECRGDISVGIGEDIKIYTNYINKTPYTVFRQDLEWDGALSVQMDCKII